MDADMIFFFDRQEALRSQRRRLWISALAIQTVVLFAHPLVATAQVPVPADLGPGDTYHLVFTSSTSRNGASANIGDYDALIQAAANAAGIGSGEGVTWRAIASTATVAARDHAVVGANTPVYNLNLQRVANGNADLWDGTLLHNLAYDEGGNDNFNDVWTGSNINGTSANGLTLGGATAWCGSATAVNSAWINNIQPSTGSILSVYGLSQVLAVPGFTINAGLNDAWKNPATPGQGFFINVFPDIGQIFLAWFTYDTERPAGSATAHIGEPGHRWLTAFGPYADNQAVLDIEITQGGVFNAANPAPTQHLDGTVILDFSDCNSGTVTYNIPSIGRQGLIPIQRISSDNTPACEALAGVSSDGTTAAVKTASKVASRAGNSPAATGSLINRGLNDAWKNPATPGQGFFINVFPNLNKMFLAWFTYDTTRPSGSVHANLADPGHRWVTAFGPYTGNQAVLDIEITQGGLFDAASPGPTQTGGGTVIVDMTDCENGTITYDIDSANLQGEIPIRRIALDNVPLCQSLAVQLQPAAIDVGWFNVCAVGVDGKAWCWGSNSFGELGTGDTAQGNVPRSAAEGYAFKKVSVSTGGAYTCGITTTGQAYCWGNQEGGRLGDGTMAPSGQFVTAPVPVSGGHTFTDIAAGGDHACAIATGGAAYCWGHNESGQHGTGNFLNSAVPAAVTGGLSFTSITTHQVVTCGIAADGAGYCWGNNDEGNLGSGSWSSSNVPVQIKGGLKFSSLQLGLWTACGVTTGGDGYCWGLNGSGELGIGSKSPLTALEPLKVVDGHKWKSISPGIAVTCGVATDGRGFCWGGNLSGERGDGPFPSPDVTSPVPVVGNLVFQSIDADWVTCGVASEIFYCWGPGIEGSIGDGAQVDRGIPTKVAGPP